MEDKNIDFIARHYRADRFNASEGWSRLGFSPTRKVARFRIAAAVAAAVVLSASAAILFHERAVRYSTPQSEIVSPQRQESSNDPMNEMKVIDFENATLAEVVEKIETTYGVKIENLPDSPESFRISLHYEGTPAELIEVINDISGTHMTLNR